MRMAGFAILLVAAAASGASVAGSDARSVYTDISTRKCHPLPGNGEPNEEDGLRCRGVAGYELLAISGDLRASVTLVGPDGNEHPLEFWNVITGRFSTLGRRAEWRAAKDGKPFALMVRGFASEDPEDAGKKTSYLAVARISPESICVTDRIAGGPGDNQRARDAADSAATRPCLAAAQ